MRCQLNLMRENSEWVYPEYQYVQKKDRFSIQIYKLDRRISNEFIKLCS